MRSCAFNPIPYDITIPVMLAKTHSGVIDSNFIIYTGCPVKRFTPFAANLVKLNKKIWPTYAIPLDRRHYL